MQKNKLKKIIIILLIIFLLLFLQTFVKGENEHLFNVTLSKDKEEINPGEEIIVSFNVNNINMGQGINAIEGTLIYDTNLLELKNSFAMEDYNNWKTTYNNQNQWNGKFLSAHLPEYITGDMDVFSVGFIAKTSITTETITQVVFKDVTSNDGTDLINIGDKSIDIKITMPIPEKEPELSSIYYVKTLFRDETTEENTFKYFNDARLYADMHASENVRVFDSKGHILYEPNIPIEDLYLSSEKYKIGETITYADGDLYISRIEPETTLAEIKQQCNTNGDIKVYKADGNELEEDEFVGTNMILRVNKDNQAIVLVTAVDGDLDGNGKITITDLSVLNKKIIGDFSINEAYEIAADENYDKKITITDLSILNKRLIN